MTQPTAPSGPNDANAPDARTAPNGSPGTSTPGAASGSDSPAPISEVSDVSAVRQLVLLAHPDTVPELVAGGTVEALLASVAPARAAYQRVIASVPAPAQAAPAAPVLPVAPTVPAGAAPPLAVDPDRLPPGEKIRRGLAARG